MASHLEFLVEEQSMQAFLDGILPKLLMGRATHRAMAHQGKPDLLAKLENRLRGYARYITPEMRLIILVDRDDGDCSALKQELEGKAKGAGLVTRSSERPWQIANRIAIEELEAWYFGNWPAVRSAFPKVPANIDRQASFRFPDAIAGGTWEAFERILQRAGYFSNGLRKVECARLISEHFDPSACVSPSFASFRSVVSEAIA